MFDSSNVILVGSPVVSCSRVVEYRTCNRKVIGSTPVGELGFSFPKYACDTDKKNKTYTMYSIGLKYDIVFLLQYLGYI